MLHNLVLLHEEPNHRGSLPPWGHSAPEPPPRRPVARQSLPPQRSLATRRASDVEAQAPTSERHDRIQNVSRQRQGNEWCAASCPSAVRARHVMKHRGGVSSIGVVEHVSPLQLRFVRRLAALLLRSMSGVASAFDPAVRDPHYGAQAPVARQQKPSFGRNLPERTPECRLSPTQYIR